MDVILQKFLPRIKRLNPYRSLTKKDLLINDFLIGSDGDLHMYYAPHNEYINNKAKIIIVGITPGWTQMKTAYEQFSKGLADGSDITRVLRDVKKAASFSGGIRAHLISMLDECGVHKVIGTKSSSALFGEERFLLHTTSVIKYPVFFQGKNYTGHQPPVKKSPLLSEFAYHVFPEELKQIEQPALIIPLGKSVAEVFSQLNNEGKVPEHFILEGFPHPSGANGHRIKQFSQKKGMFREIVNAWANTMEG